jgi:N-acetylmuramoyl-L-alanine amidase
MRHDVCRARYTTKAALSRPSKFYYGLSLMTRRRTLRFGITTFGLGITAFRFTLALLCAGALCRPLAAQTPSSFEIAARARGTPDIPGLNIIWLTPWGDIANAREWQNIIVHQTEGPAGSAYRGALAQMEKPNRRGATIWVETDGTVYWAVAEFAVPRHIRGGNRNDNKFIDNGPTFQQVNDDNSIGVEFTGNYPNVRRPVTEAQTGAWRMLLRVLQARYGIASDHVYAHDWIDYKDRRYCEGCELAKMRTQDLESASRAEKTR